MVTREASYTNKKRTRELVPTFKHFVCMAQARLSMSAIVIGDMQPIWQAEEGPWSLPADVPSMQA